ncbi:hypothetical protein BJV82DRAFT_668756 [Fennellomyces sp. T-0311]|nr:hypothetical protein BJV82DRAFT_668756 [Fennellomyces sp. T-0311]
MDSELASDIRTFKEKSLNLYELQKEYNEQTGLSLSGSADHQSINLPLHPSTLQKELDDYKSYAKELETALIQRETKEGFLRLLQQDPPPELTADELRTTESRVAESESRMKASLDKVNDLKRIISDKNARIEQLHATLSAEADKATRMLDEIRIYTEELESIQRLLSDQSDLTLEDAYRIEEELLDESVNVNMEIDERRDNINRLGRKVAEDEQTVQDLELRLRGLQAEASGTQLYKEQYQQLEASTNWYQSLTKELNTMVGIDDFVSSPSSLIVRYANADKTELHINFNAKNHVVEDAWVANTRCQIRDILELAKSHRRLSDAMIAIIYGTLARLKNNTT